MAKKGSAAPDLSKISRPKPPKVLHLGVKDRDGFIRRAKRRYEKLKEQQLAHH
jgi:hypothetical protein